MGRTALTRSVRGIVAVVAVFAALAGNPSGLHAQYDQPGAPRTGSALTILQVNDVYSTVPIDGRGGLARVATLKRHVAASGANPVLMLAGDFLSTSVTSTVFKGEQMIASLNAAGLDMATLGNHEFDFGVDVLLQRMAEAKFQWVVSNVLDRRTGRPIGGAEPYVIRTFDALKVGIIGLCLAGDPITRDTLDRIEILDPIATAQKYIPLLEAEQVDAIIALTHLAYADDRALAERFPAISVIVGGHEHIPITATVGSTLISKAGTEARYVARIDVKRIADRPLERHFELIEMTGNFAEDPLTASVAGSFEARLEAALDVEVGRSRVPLDGLGARLRTSETNLGNFIADGLRASVDAQIAITNSGGIRSDRVHAPGPLLRRQLLEIHPFGNTVCKIEIPGRVLLAALEHAVAKLPAPAGEFLQVSGLTMDVLASAPPGQRVRNVQAAGLPLDPDRVYTVALPNYLLLGGDGYAMFEGARVIVGPDIGRPMSLVLEQYIGGREIAPAIEKRIRIAP